MKYGKLNNNNIEYAPQTRILRVNGKQIINPTENSFLAAGFKKIIYTDFPDLKENEIAETKYEETDTEIIILYDVKLNSNDCETECDELWV